MANFDIAYKITARHEGGYANNPKDKGGETYAGIARNFFPGWQGWRIIDGYKAKGPIAWNTKIKNSQLETMVKDFYYSEKWTKEARANELTNQLVANFIYDFVVNSGRAENVIDQAINKAIAGATGIGVNVRNNRLDDASIKLLNLYPEKIYPLLIEERKKYVQSLDDFKTFGKTWMNRILSFPSSIVGAVTSIAGDEQKKK